MERTEDGKWKTEAEGDFSKDNLLRVVGVSLRVANAPFEGD